MIINEKMISLPPYLSTYWENVTSLYSKGNSLVVTLTNGQEVSIPNLTQEIMTKVFSAHCSFLDQKSKEPSNKESVKTSPSTKSHEPQQTFAMPFRLGIEGFGGILQHNPAQADFPPLPDEILNKIRAIAGIINPEEISQLPKAEPHCHCMYCQIARALSNCAQEEVLDHPENNQEEEVKDEELQFPEWDITQAGHNLFTVTSRENKNEKYSVYLGDSVGCTCGKTGCPHILAVLRT